MRRTLVALLFILHGLAHAAAGVWALDVGPWWLVTVLWWIAMAGYVGAGFGLLGVAGLRHIWEPLAVAATVGSLVLLWLFGHVAVLWGMLVDVVILVGGLHWGESAIAARLRGRAGTGRTPEPPRHRVARAAIGGVAFLFLGYLSAVILLRPWHTRWGVSDDELRMRLPGDALVPEAHYRMDHAITIRAPADTVWAWLVQIGQDRAGFYSYDRLERMVGADIRNADRIHPEWQRRAEGELVRAVQPDFLGGRLGRDIGWRVAEVEPARALVLEGWGAFVVRPVDDSTTRLHIRLRGEGTPTLRGTLLGPVNLLVFEPAHFVMERGMLLGIKRRAEGGA